MKDGNWDELLHERLYNRVTRYLGIGDGIVKDRTT